MPAGYVIAQLKVTNPENYKYPKSNAHKLN